MFPSRILPFVISKKKHTQVFFFIFHHFPSFSIIFHHFPPKNHQPPTLSIPGPPGPVPPAQHRPPVPGRQRHRGAPARAPGAAAGRRGAGLPAAGPGADAGEAAAGRVGRLDGVGGNGWKWGMGKRTYIIVYGIYMASIVSMVAMVWKWLGKRWWETPNYCERPSMDIYGIHDWGIHMDT